jgi:hypothetical protein
LRPDGVYAALGGDASLVAPLVRRGVEEGRVIARWRDGTPAVTERASGLGCVRDVGIGLPLAGDVTLREPFAQLLAVLAEPCGGARRAALSDSALAAFAGSGALAAATEFATERTASVLAPWLLALALLLLVVEQWWRRRRVAELA